MAVVCHGVCADMCVFFLCVERARKIRKSAKLWVYPGARYFLAIRWPIEKIVGVLYADLCYEVGGFFSWHVMIDRSTTMEHKKIYPPQTNR